MRQLDTCDFCGDAADGVYEVVPAAVAGESRRLALCVDCRGTLQSVVDPLLDAAQSPPAAAPESETEPSERTDDDAEPDAPAPDDSTSESDGSDADDGIVIESGSADEPEATETADDSEATGTEDGDEADTGNAQPKRRPSGYAQVIRLLQNRDGAMPREDLRALATNAYDLGGREFDDAVEAAVENGDLEESQSGLRTA